MIIGFDTRVFWSEDCHNGIWRYAQNLLLQLQSLCAQESITLKVFCPPGRRELPNGLTPNHRTELVDAAVLRYPRLWELGGVAIAGARSNADLIFSPSYHTSPLGTLPVIPVIHDATPVKSPSSGRLRNSMQKLLLWSTAKFSTHCITTSQHSKRDLVDIYNLPNEKVTVIYNGYDKTRFNVSASDLDKQQRVFAKYGLTRAYILHHGAIQPRKNLARLIQAFNVLLNRRREFNFDLVLAGPLAWRFNDVLAIAKRPMERGGRIIMTGPVDDDEMPLLVKGATLSVMPSLYEGFCLPLIESMACGVPAIASNSSCIPEVSGGALEYFNPLSVHDIAGCMERVLDDSALRQRLIREGTKRASEFSWERCARETLSVLKDVFMAAHSQASRPETASV